MSERTTYAIVYAGTGNILLNRVVGSSGSYITQATTSTITCAVDDMTTGMAVSVITPAIVVATAIYDQLQTGALWESKDATGYNFYHAMPATAFPTAGRLYRVIYTFTPTSGAVYTLRYFCTAA